MPANNTKNIYSAEYEQGMGPTTAADVSYDNTNSHLTADDVQEAIDECAAALADIEASAVSSEGIGETTNVQDSLDYIMSVKIDGAYDNTSSGLSATTIQEAIDEVAGDVSAITGKILQAIETAVLPNCTSYPTIISNLKTDMEAVIAALPDDESISILGLSIDGFGFFPYYGSRSLWANNTATTYLGSMFTRVRNENSTVLVETMATTGCKRATISDSSFVVKDFVVDEPSTTLVARLQYMRFKNV